MAKRKLTIKKIKKRDGRIVPFNQRKITNAIWKAAEAVGGKDRERAQYLSDKVIDILEKRFNGHTIATVEQIQDIVEAVLMRRGHYTTAKAYILYRDLHNKIRDVKSLIDSDELMGNYINGSDWRIKENSNMAYSLQGLNNHVASTISKHYWLNQFYPKAVRDAHQRGDMHIHNLQLLAPYCVGWDLQDLLIRGFTGVPGKAAAKPAKHLRTALGQLANFFYTLQGESAGANAVSNFDTLLAPFVWSDKLSYKWVRQAMQEFLFNMNVPTRVGFQTPFSNITFDLTPPSTFANEAAIVEGKPINKQYKNFQKEMNMINRAFAELMAEGDAQGRVFTFPIPTYNITRDFDWDNKNLTPVWEMTAKYGIPYFSNFINSDMKPEDARSMCCRLRLDNRELRKRGGGLFGSNPLTGCYDEQTEILTENGWEFFKDLNKSDKIFTLTESNKIELHNPKKIFKYDHEGEMYQFKTKSLDLLVTPNHRMVIDHIYNNKRKFVEAENFDVNNHRIPKQSIWQGKEREWFLLPGIEFTKYGRQGRTPYRVTRDALRIRMNDWLAFFGFWLADGCTDNEKIAKGHGYRTIITQLKKERRKEIKEILDALPFNYAEEKNNFVICNKQLWTYLRQFGKKYTKFVPQEIKNLSKEQLRILFDWMVKGDGHVRKTTGQINYWTSSKKLADDLQEIILKLGWLGTLTVPKRKVSRIKGRKIKAGICYVIGVQKAKHYRLRKNNIKKVSYRGKIYCCEVKNNTVFVRRNGKVCWCGNSIGVVTLNMSRIGYLAKDEKDYFKRLTFLMDIAKDSLLTKRQVLERLTEQGLYPYSKFYLSSVKKRFGGYWKNHFNTIGIHGMNESVVNFMNEDIGSPKGKKFGLKVLDFMRKRLANYQKEANELFNLEATPAEGTTYRFATLDKKLYPKIKVANENDVQENGGEPYYSNSSQLPVGYTDDIFEALELQDELQTKYTGGTVLHGFLGEAVHDGEAAKRLVKRIAENYHLPYYTLSPTFSVCQSHGYLKGEQETCPECGKTTEIFSRVVGYLRPVQQWNPGKQSEFWDRKGFKVQ